VDECKPLERGTTMTQIVQMCRLAGASKVGWCRLTLSNPL